MVGKSIKDNASGSTGLIVEYVNLEGNELIPGVFKAAFPGDTEFKIYVHHTDEDCANRYEIIEQNKKS